MPVMGILPDLFVGESRTGRGVFAGRAFRGEDPIHEWTGKLCLRERLEAGSTPPVQAGPGLFLPAGDPIGDFFNHSCDPNAALIVAEGRIVLRAIREINSLEELVFDYSVTAAGEGLSITCLCGSGICRGTIGDWATVPAANRARYMALGIVPDFVRSA